MRRKDGKDDEGRSGRHGMDPTTDAPAVGVEGVVGGEARGVALAHLRVRLDVRPLPAAQEAAGLERLQPCREGRNIAVVGAWDGGKRKSQRTPPINKPPQTADCSGGRDGRTREGEGAGEVEADGPSLVECLLEGPHGVTLIVRVPAHAALGKTEGGWSVWVF